MGELRIYWYYRAEDVLDRMGNNAYDTEKGRVVIEHIEANSICYNI